MINNDNRFSAKAGGCSILMVNGALKAKLVELPQFNGMGA